MRVLLCLVPLVLVACGPAGVGYGIYELLNPKDNIDPTNIPQFEVKPHALNDKNERGIWAGKNIGLSEDHSDPNVLPVAPYIQFFITRGNGPVAGLRVFVKLAPESEYTVGQFDELDFMSVKGVESPLAGDGSGRTYTPKLEHLQAADKSQWVEQTYRIQFRVEDQFGRRNETPKSMVWTLDNTRPATPVFAEAIDRSDRGKALENLIWTVPADESPRNEFYDIIFLPDKDFDDEDPDDEIEDLEPHQGDFDRPDLFDPRAPKARPTGDAMIGEIGRWPVKATNAAVPTTAEQTADEKSMPPVRNFVAAIPTGIHTVCVRVYIAVIAVDLANNRSALAVSPYEFVNACLPPRDPPIANGAASSAVSAQLVKLGESTYQQLVDLNGDGCDDIVTIGKDGVLRVVFAECVDGRPTGKFLEKVVSTDADDFSVLAATAFSRNRGGPSEFVAIGETDDGKRIGLLRLAADGLSYEPSGVAVELPEPIRSEYSPAQIVTAIDIDRDGYRDILVRAVHDAGTKSDFLVGYMGVGNDGRASDDLTTYRPVSTQAGLRAREAVFGYFNDDTLGDVALCDGEILRILVGTPTLTTPHRASGSYETKRTVVPDILDLIDQGLAPPVVEGGPEFLAAKDLDGDGIEDIVMSNAGGSVSVLLGAADNDFGVPTTYSAIPAPEPALTEVASPGAGPVAIGDLNLDGILDLFVASVVDDSVSMLLGNGTDGKWDGTFAAAVAVPMLFDPVSIAAGDIDRDGILDLTLSDETGLKAAVLEGSGFLPSALGTFTKGPVLQLPLHTADKLALLDLDGDAILDLVAAGMRTGAGIQTLYLGEGTDGLATGEFGPGLTRGIGDGPTLSLATADVNRDAIPDLVGASSSGVDVQFGVFSEEDQRFLFESDELYSFKPAPGAAGDVIAQSIVGDFNGDGITDIVSRAADTINVLLGKNDEGRTDGGFLFEYKTPADFLDAGEELKCGGIADFTELLENLDTGLRNELTDVVVPGAIGAADFDGDGALDVVVADEEQQKLAVLRNYGRDCGDGAEVDYAGFGMFEAPKLHDFLGFVPGPIVVDDFNGDGIPDVAAIAQSAGTLAETFCVMLGQREDFAESDLPSLDKFSFADPIPVGNRPNSPAIAAADLDRDGNVDIIVVDKTEKRITIYFGDGSGNYGGATTKTVVVGVDVAEPRSIAVGDLNGDRVPDIAVGGAAGVQIIYGDAGIR